MESVPGAVATGSRATEKVEFAKRSYPVATAAGTDLVRQIRSSNQTRHRAGDSVESQFAMATSAWCFAVNEMIAATTPNKALAGACKSKDAVL